MNRRKLEQLTREFVDEQTTLLNTTVTQGVPLSSAGRIDSDGPRIAVGFGISPTNIFGDVIPLTVSRAVPQFGLRYMQVLTLDESDSFLCTTTSSCAIYLHLDEIVRYETDNRRPDTYPYPKHHLHVRGLDDQLLINARGRSRNDPAKLHWPAADEFYPPALVHIIRFLIVEGFVEAHPGWEQAVEDSLSQYRAQQQREAILADLDNAEAVLRQARTRAD